MRQNIFRIMLVAMLAALLGACRSMGSYDHSTTVNGIPRLEEHGSYTPWHAESHTNINNQRYPTAVAEYGPMPGGIEIGLATQRIIVQDQRTNMTTLYGYGGYGYGYGWGAGYHYRPQFYQRQIIPLSPGVRAYPGQFYAPPPQPYSPYSGF